MTGIPNLRKHVFKSCTACEGTAFIRTLFTESVCRTCRGFGRIENEGEYYKEWRSQKALRKKGGNTE
jgi:DnaJ-class molecular chaperone